MAAAHNPQLITIMSTTTPFSSRAILNRAMSGIPCKREDGSRKTRGRQEPGHAYFGGEGFRGLLRTASQNRTTSKKPPNMKEAYPERLNQ